MLSRPAGDRGPDLMYCSHSNTDTPLGRIAMLFSGDGVGCYSCKSRIALPGRVRAFVFALLVASFFLRVLEEPFARALSLPSLLLATVLVARTPVRVLPTSRA